MFLFKISRIKNLFIDLLSLYLIVMIIVTGVSIYVGYKVMNPMRLAIKHVPSEYKLDYEDVTFRNMYDGVKLKGWWIPSSKYDFGKQKAVIFSHSYGDNRVNMPIDTLKLAKRFSDEGFHVLMYDFRNSGESGEGYATIGRKETTDLLSAIEYVKEEKNVYEIALVGWSMGAATSIIVGSKSDDVKAVIADSPFADLEGYTSKSFSYWTGLPSSIGNMMIKIADNVFIDLDLSAVKPYLAARRYENKGLMLIHSKKDGAISFKQSELIYQNAPHAELWITKKGGHIRNYKHQKVIYEDRIIEFINRYISDSSPFVRS